MAGSAPKGPLREVVGLPAMRRIALAYFGFISAEYAVWVAMLVYAFGRGGSREAAVVSVVQLVPSIAVAPLAGVVAERHDARKVLTLGYAALAASLTLTALALGTTAPPLVVYAVATLATGTMTVARPAQAVITPALARTPAELTAVNLVTGWAENTAVFVAPALAGALLGWSGPAAVYGAAALVMVAAAAFTVGLRPTGAAIATTADPDTGPDSDAAEAHAEVTAGLRTIRDERPARLVVLVITAGYAVIGAIDVLAVVLAVDVLGLGEAGAGYLVAAVGAGGVLGSVAGVMLIGRRRLAPALVGSALVGGGALALLAGLTTTTATFVLLAVVGLSRSVLFVAGNTLLQRTTPPASLARVFALVEALMDIGLAAGSIAVPLLVAAGGSTAALVGVGAILPAVVLLRLRPILAVDRAATVPIVELSLFRRMRIFAALPAPALEGLARSAEAVDVAAGTAIMRQGEPGDRFYAIADGEVEIRRDGAVLAVRGRGDGIGEIALLRDVPRTADATALSAVKLFSLDREAFVVALTGHEPARVEADRIIGERDMGGGPAER